MPSLVELGVVKVAPRVYNKSKGYVPHGAVYIGRGTPWGNPFIISDALSRDDACDMFEEFILPTMNLEGLKGKNLLCSCHPKRCHGDSILKKLAKDTL